MTVFIRPATRADTRQIAALAGPRVPPEAIADWMDAGRTRGAWHLAEDETGAVLGFQQIGPRAALPTEACEIATFLANEPLPPGAAAQLFEATAASARRLRYAWISADIATGNDAARVYYQNRGFRLYSTGTARLSMRFDLD